MRYRGADDGISPMTARAVRATATERGPPAKAIDGVFRALSDPTRRNVLERLSQKPSSVSELAAGTRMALPSFVAHLKVLEGAGLVRSKKVGRVRTYELAPAQLRLAEDWLGRQRSMWERRLDRLDAYLLQLKKERNL
jgi:DNA-binding transcriptional ArsR family regulator